MLEYNHILRLKKLDNKNIIFIYFTRLDQVEFIASVHSFIMTVSVLQPLSNKLSFDTIDRDNWIFKLFSRWTVGIFLFASAFSFATSYSDSAITCKAQFNLDYLNTYCWSGSDMTLQLSDRWSSDDEKDCRNKVFDDETNDNRIHMPHIWVSLMLLIQGVSFTIPDIIWQWFEGGTLDQFRADRSNRLLSENGSVEIFNGLSKRKTRRYFFSFIFCECLNLVFTFINFVVMNTFLHGLFSSKIISCMGFIFPTTVSCDFSHERRDNTLCFLGQNMINQKMYLMLWAWFMVLFFAIVCMIVIRLLSLCFPKYRKATIEAYTKSKGVEKLACIQNLSEGCGNIGHWFLLTQIGRNSLPYNFKNFLEEINSGKKLKDKTDTMEMHAVDESRNLYE